MPSPEHPKSSFVEAICNQLTQSLNQVSRSRWRIESREATQSTPDAATDAIFRLTAEGPLRGDFFITFSLADLPQLDFDETANAGQTLATALSAFALSLQTILFAPGEGSITCTRVEKLDQDELAVPGQMQVTTEDGARSFTVNLIVDKSLLDFRPVTSATNTAAQASNLDLVLDVELDVTLRFGQRQLPLREVLELKSGAVVELDRQVDEPVELVLDGRVVALGEAVIIDGNYGIRITQVVQTMVSV